MARAKPIHGMRILMMIDGLALGGAERRMLSLVERLEHKPGYEIEIVVLSYNLHYKEQVSNLRAKTHYIKRFPKKDPTVFFKILRICRDFRPELIQTWTSMSTIYALPAKWIYGIRLINNMITGAPIKIHKDIQFRAWISFPFSDIICANSEAGIRVYKPSLEKAVTIHNGFDFSRILDMEDPKLVRSRLGITTNFAVGMVGRLDRNKDFRSFILSALKILNTRQDITFVLIGGGWMEKELRELIPESLFPNFCFTGTINKVEPVVNMLDIGCLFSTNGEGISNAIMEYMALGLPVIASRMGGNAELVDDNITGFLIPGNDISQITEKITLLLNNEELRKEMGRTGLQRIKDHFSIDRMIDNYIQLYNRVLS